ncbi:MAG: LacI family DNA-binding transcriptional regulator [Clostridium sp.]
MNNRRTNIRATSKDVAKLAGVSQSTVSRVFNKTGNRVVKEEIEKKVLQIAKEIGYKPNIIARGLVSKKTNLIGIVVGNPIGPFYSDIIINLVLNIQKMGDQSIVFTLEKELDFESIVEKVQQYQIDGVVITSSAISEEILDVFIEKDIGIVLLNMKTKMKKISSVYIDNIEAGRMVAKMFIEKNLKKVAFVNYKNERVVIKERQIGFYSELKKQRDVEIREFICDYSYDEGYTIGKEILKIAPKIQGVFCVSDIMAIGIIDAIKHESDLRIPEDIAIVGFDDIKQASWKSYNLTSVKQPVEELVKETVKILFEGMDNEKVIEKEIKPKVIIRKST